MAGRFFRALPEGYTPFAEYRPDVVLRELRRCLQELQVPGAMAYRTHDFRRGHAEDLRISGAGLGEILRAGDWKSPAFLQYLDREQLERDRVLEAHLDDSSGDEM